MLKEIITKLFKKRHFWRYVGFAELAELYASRMMRLLALNMITVLIAVFLYQSGYSVVFIATYFALYFLVRIIFIAPAIATIAWIGPKHSILWANVLYIPALLFLLASPMIGLPALAAVLFFKAMSTTLYDVAYLVDFSKVKHVEHAGKELGFMHIFEKLATAASPLIGGVVAFLFGPQVTIIVATLLFVVAAAPLFLTPEPIPTRQKIVFSGFRLRPYWRNLIAEGAGAFSTEASNGGMWSLFILIVVIGTMGNAVYAEIGILSAIALLASLAVSYLFGLLIDRRRGGELLQVSVVGLAILHLIRPFLSSTPAVAAMNVANEAAITGYKMPFLRGMFDEADMKAGYRILYLASMSTALCLGAALANGLLALFAQLYGEKLGLQLTIIAAAFVVLLVATHKFALYRR